MRVVFLHPNMKIKVGTNGYQIENVVVTHRPNCGKHVCNGGLVLDTPDPRKSRVRDST